MSHVRDGSDDTERARKRCRQNEATLAIGPVHMTTTSNGKNAATSENGDRSIHRKASNYSEYNGEYSNPLFPRTSSAINGLQTAKTYMGDTTVGDSGILVQGDITHNHYHMQGSQQDNYQVLLESLTFERMDARLRNVAMPFTNTCQWLYKHDLFCRWVDKDYAQKHHGFFWIKGKPGSGKSTIMKELVTWAQRTWKPQCVITYFFNARSPQHLEKSTVGLYRSLLHQLLLVEPHGQLLFVDGFASKIRTGKGVEEWSIVELQNFLIELITKTNIPNVNIFIDALDEGDTDDNRQMITFLDQLARFSFLANKFTRICLSSRHYPHISVRKGLSLVLEEQPSHKIDIDNYIQSELDGHDSRQMDQLRREISERSAGVFLWVVLVIPLLRRGLDRGKSVLAMRQELSHIPQDLRKMFVEILSRDVEGMNECIVLLRWVLFSQRPLSLAEIHGAMKQACSLRDTGEEADLHDSTPIKYLLHCSRGLIEATMDDNCDWRCGMDGEVHKLVQFIHETVREFLLVVERGSELALGTSDAQPDMAQNFQADACHMQMADECMRYVLRLSKGPLSTEILGRFPLTDYAARYWHVHLRACSNKITQRMMDLASLILTNKYDHNLLAVSKVYGCSRNDETTDMMAPPLYRAVYIGVPELVSTLLSQGVDIEARNDTLDTALIAAADCHLPKILQLLLNHGANINARNNYGETALLKAAGGDDKQIVQMLLEHGACIMMPSGRGDTALSRAAHRGHETVVQILLDNALVNPGHENSETALSQAILQNHRKIVEMLLEYGVRVAGNSLIFHAMIESNETLVQVLVKYGSDIDAPDRLGYTPLAWAVCNNDEKVAKILLHHGCKTNLRNASGLTPLHHALYKRKERMVQLLLKHGADADALTEDGCPPLCWATTRRQTGMVQLLLKHKADPDTKLCTRETLEKDVWRASVLQAAVIGCHDGGVRLLLESGANVHVPVIYEERDESCWKVCTLLQLAAMSEDVFGRVNPDIVQMLHDYGAPEAFSSEEKRTILLEHPSLVAREKEQIRDH